MSWLTDVVRPKIRTLLGQREVPDNLWRQCPACQQMVFHRDLERNLKVCTHCGHHMRATAIERLGWTFDEGSYTRIELPKVPADPLKFRDQKRYVDRLREAREKTGMEGRHRRGPWRDRRPSRGGGGDGVRVHGRLDGRRGRRGDRHGGAAGGAAGCGAGHLHRVGRGAHAGRRDQPDADAAHDHRHPHGEGGRAAVHRRADRSDHRRGDGQLRDAGGICRSPNPAR